MTGKPGPQWISLAHPARLYVASVIAIGACVFAANVPLVNPRPALFAAMLAVSCLISLWKANLPISLTSGATLSVSYAVSLAALVLLGPAHAMVVTVAGVCAQCTLNVRQPYPLHRTAFMMAAEAITMVVTGAAYTSLGGRPGPMAVLAIATPLVGAMVTYFIVNTGLVAAAIALATGRSVWRVWHDDFLWIGPSFIVAGTAGAISALVIEQGQQWLAVLTLVPVYLTYRSYQIFVTHLRLLEPEHAARESAEQANRQKDQFLAIVSHELRTPLNAILGWADMLRCGAIQEGRRDRAFQAIYDSARSQSQLIEELLDVARIVSGKLKLELGVVDVREIVSHALEIVQPPADARRIQLAVDIEPTVGSIHGDGARLQQVVWNLMTNAVKFTPDEGTVHLRVGPTGRGIEITVTDNGRGIPRDFLPYVFEPFRQAEGSTTRRHGGLGLGLAIVKHLVEAHGGTVRAESGGEGCGSTFIVALPTAGVAAAPSQTAGASGAAVATSAGDMARTAAALDGMSVLVVDDDEESRAVVAAYLERQHASVTTAASAAAAFELVQRDPPDVLLADIAMPGEDGYSLIRKLRTCSSPVLASLPAAAITSCAREEDRRHALQAGFQRHLSKPIDPLALINTVARLGKHRQLRM